MSKRHNLLLLVSGLVIAGEVSAAVYFYLPITAWLSHNLWIVFVPFLKVLFKSIIALNFLSFIKAVLVLFWHLSKLLLLKMFKTLSVRYGIFFSQARWYWIRKAKVMFLRRGKQFFRSLLRFWIDYTQLQKWIVLIAFFPFLLLLFLLGLSFNLTRKTMVQKAQESAIFEMAATASNTNRGIRAWVARLDKLTLQKIRDLTIRVKPNGSE